MSTAFTIVSLGAEHDRTNFDCGVAALNSYLQRQAGQDVRRHVANCFIASPTGSTSVAGYYTLSAASVPLDELNPDLVKRLPRYPIVPAARIGRLAVDNRYRRQRLGSALLYDAAERALRSDAAIFAILVDAKDDEAKGFYTHHGFTPFSSRPKTLYLPIETLKML